MTAYVINYKNTTINEDYVMDVDSGIMFTAYSDIKDAIKKIYELTDDILNSHRDELDANCDDIYRDTMKDGRFQIVHIYDDLYEFFISEIEIV